MSGKLSNLVTDGSTQLAGVIPGSKFSSLNIRVCNPTGLEQTVQVYLTDNSKTAPALADLVEPGAVVPVNGTLALTCEVASAGEKVWIKTAAGLVVRLSTIDEQ